MSTAGASGAGWRANRWYRGIAAVVLSVVVNAGLVSLAVAAGIAPGFRPLAVAPVAIFSAVGAIGALVVYLALGRFTASPDRLFRAVAVVVLLLSFVPDVALLFVDEAATVAGVVVLMMMHATVAAICVWLIPEGTATR